MSKISRTFFRLFGSGGTSDNFGQFGSKRAGAPVTTKDVTVIQALDAWNNGIQDAVVSANKAPYLQDLNGLFYAFAKQIAYVLQDGIPTWDTSTSYYIGSIVHADGTPELYMSLTNDNVGHALPNKTDNAFWQYLRFGPPVGSVIAYAAVNDPFSGFAVVPPGYLRCNGQAVSRTGYADLFLVLGTTWGIGDGSTTFNVPDLRERVIFGDGSDPGFSVGSTGGALIHTHTQAAHSHTVPSHSHVLVNTGADQSPITTFGKTVQANSGGQLGTDPTFSGIGIGPKLVSGTTTTVSGVSTGTANPAIGTSDFLPQYAAMQWMIKT